MSAEQENLKSLCENVIEFPVGNSYAAIIGLNPSEGARSPKLWNAVFKEIELTTRMIPLDIAKENINNALNVLDHDPNFIAGAVAAPYKEVVFDYFFDRLDVTTKKIGAVNCIFRGHDGRLTAFNTDGEGAISALSSSAGHRKYRKAIVLGSGGTAKAVTAFLAPALGMSETLWVASRSRESGKKIAKSCGAHWISWADISLELSSVDLIVNCTTLGSAMDVHSSPLSKTQIKSLKDSTVVYDVIYQPSKTKLIQLAKDRDLMAIGGLGMNLEQAVIACGKAIGGDVPLKKIRKIMMSV